MGTLSQLEACVCSAARSARVVPHEGRAQRFSEVESWHWHRSGARTCLSNRGDHLDHPESRTTLCKMRSENPLEAVLSARALSSLWALGIGAAELIMDLERPNYSMRRKGASRLAHFLYVSAWRLAPTADGGRWARWPTFSIRTKV